MFLSNRSTLLILFSILSLFLASCGSGLSTANNGSNGLQITDSNFPFSTIEPAVFQANFVVTSEGREKRWFLARNNDRWRLDIFKGDAPSLTQIRTDKLYLVDHVSRTYAEEPPSNEPFEAPDPILSGFFRGKEHYEFEELGHEGRHKKFRVKPGDRSKDDIIILIDEPSGMIIKQDFYDGIGEQAQITLSYEVRDLRLTVEDTVFALPTGYRQVDPAALRRLRFRQDK